MQIKRVVDLSRPISPGMQVYPGDPQPQVREVATVAADGFWLHEIVMGSQTATHYDAPAHVIERAAASEELNIDRFVAVGRIVDACAVGADGLIDHQLVEPALAGMALGFGVLIHTGWDEYDGTDTAWRHPGLSVAAAELLVQRGVSFVGVDAGSIDRHDDDHLPSHHILAAAGIPIIENLTNLSAVDWPDPLIVAAPIHWPGIDGAPLRALAIEFI